MSSDVTRVVVEGANAALWPVLGQELPDPPSGRARDPYMEQGCHPDVVARVWDELGRKVFRDCRAQARGRPVLAHPDTDRIFAFARGTSYALWVTPEDLDEALDAGASPAMTWAGGSVTDLAELVGPGWLWGRWLAGEPSWLRRAYDAVGSQEPGG